MKLRQPPYGKRIFEARQRGEHPLELHVHFGGPPSNAHDRFRLNGIWVPADVEPATLDWRVAAGIPVILWDHSSPKHRADKKLLLTIAGEISEYASWIWVISLRFGGELSRLAMRLTAEDPEPLIWWPDERAQRYAERHRAWCDAFHRCNSGGGVHGGGQQRLDEGTTAHA